MQRAREGGFEHEYPELVRELLHGLGRVPRHLSEVLMFGVSALLAIRPRREVMLVHPVSPLRGVPPDVSSETGDEFEEDSSAHGFALLSELEAFDWDQPVVEACGACLSAAPGANLRGYWNCVGKLPKGEGWQPYGDPHVYEGLTFQSYTRSTGRTYREACAFFLERAMPKLRSYGAPDEVRLVFWIA